MISRCLWMGLVLAVFVTAACAPAVRAEDWPQFRGPHFNGSTTEKALPQTWSTDTNVAWKVALPGPGASTPIVVGERVFFTAVDAGTKDLLALCLNAKTGAERWRRKMGSDRKAQGGNTMASPTPASDGQSVFFMFGTGVLAAFDLDGAERWSRDLEKDYGEFVIKFGFSSSPLLYKGRVYVPIMQNVDPKRYNKKAERQGPLDSFLLCIDAANGKTLWKQARPNDAKDEGAESYQMPIPFEDAGRSLILLMGGECVTANDAQTGEELWRWWFSPRDRQIYQRVVNCALVMDGLICVTRPKNRAVYALKPGAKGEVGDEFIAWRNNTHAPDCVNPLYYNGRLYLVHEGKRAMACLDARTGKPVWEHALPGKGPMRASPIGADGKIYLITQEGLVIVMAAGDEYKELAVIPMGEEPCHATMTAANGRLYLRTAKSLYCLTAPSSGGQ